MKKVLSFVLVLTLVLSSFSMAFAADSNTGSLTDIAGNANEDAIQVAYDLAIVTGNPDGTFLPDKAVNRAEFAAMITRALAIPDSALAGYTTTSFKDISGYSWAVPYLAFCQSKGILLGDGAGNVMPGKTITVNEAMTMALRAIGYTANSSQLVGVWPSNYVSIAQNNDLYTDVAKETTVNKASAAQIIYNLLTVQKVAVNTDGSTESLWKDTKEATAANLLNTNLNCSEFEDVVLGDDYDYDDAIINITSKLGAYGTAYLNDDDELVAFKVKSTALTGKMDGDKFKVGDDKYDLGSNAFTGAALIANGVKLTESKETAAIGATTASIKIAKAEITSFAAVYADNNKTVTINADVSGKKIKDIYSVVGWKADAKDLADADVQEDIADKELLSIDFVENDDKNIDMNSFQLVGVASLDKIEKDHVVYVYAESSSKDIRKVAVGTEKIEGIIDEIETDSDDDKIASTITIGGKDYDVSALATDDAKGVDVDSEGIFYLDYKGEIYDFDGTSGKADTYGVVKSADPLTSNALDRRVRLYTSDDSTKTFTADDVKDMDWITRTGGPATASAIAQGALVGYSLNSAGEIDTFDVSKFDSNNVDFRSTKVLKLNNTTYNIDKDAKVFTYSGSTFASDIDSYDVISLEEVNKGEIATTGALASVILDDKDVVALLIHEKYADTEDDAIYGVLNSRTNAKDSSGDPVYRYKGFIDGTPFSLLTDGTSGFNKDFTGAFGVYAITKDATGAVTKIEEMTAAPKTEKGKEASGIILAAEKITDVNSDKTVVTTDTGKYTIADDAVVYKYDKSDKEFETAKLSALRKNYTVSLYDTKGDDADGIATVVIYIED